MNATTDQAEQTLDQSIRQTPRSPVEEKIMSKANTAESAGASTCSAGRRQDDGNLGVRPDDALLPCPFCGETPEVSESFWFDLYSVKCGNKDCGVNPWTGNYHERWVALAVWNRRAGNQKH